MLNTDNTRAGANACMNLLRAMEDLETHLDDSEESWWATHETAIGMMQSSFGITSEYQAGFLAALAEYVHFINVGSGVPNLARWKPEATMTDNEIEAERKKIAEFSEWNIQSLG
jgi:hypothetical protein